jgi:predicted O-methyltransferase YrrM
MNLQEIMSGLQGINLGGVSLALRKPAAFRGYLSECLRRYDEYAGNGLQPKDPVAYLKDEARCLILSEDRVRFPPRIIDGGGTSLEELLVLAASTRILQPKKVFEIGTFNGRTTSCLILNAAPNAKVISLDLPVTPEAVQTASDGIDSDQDLIKRRKLAAYVYEFKLESGFQQVLCDSMKFDPEPYRDSIELGFVDGAHTRAYVQNDTEKMAVMMAERGLVFWHDYGGKGDFRPLSRYLDELSRKIQMFRVANTTLAWTTASELRKLR